MFLLPGCASLMAAAIARWRVLVPVVVAGAVVAAVAQVPTWAEDPLALPQAAAAVERVHATGGRAPLVYFGQAPAVAAPRGLLGVSRGAHLPAAAALCLRSRE